MTLNLTYVGTLPPHPGGSAISAALILVGLASRGHTVRCVAPLTGSDDDGFAIRHPELQITRFPVSWYETDPSTPPPVGYHERQQAAVCRLLAGLFDEARPDVCFVGRETFVPGVVDLAHAQGVPVVLRVAGSLTAGLAAGAYPDGTAAALLADLKKVEVCVSPGRHLAEVARALHYGDVRVIANAADCQAFGFATRDPALMTRLGIPPGAVVVAHVSNLKPVKRPLDVVRSAATACSRDSRLFYLIIGDGPLRLPMEAAVRAAGLADRVRFVGWRPYQEMPTYLAAADLVVMPSASEGLARVYVETLASGRVLVASDIPAAREVVVDGVTGLLFPCGDVTALTETTLEIANDPQRRQTIGRHARQFARGYDLAPAIDAYERVLALVSREAIGRPTPLASPRRHAN
ncbi:MAG TPA: glycosyltransferase family 4 protein [Candidatus Methylomirabilis sp.]|nr:glycosyltransferase family 4 protein [Candidatus Methylomirabilis sp.]